MRYAVVGHVEWVDFARVARLPVSGEIVQADETWSEPAGGGAVAAVELARLSGSATFFTALADDTFGDRARQQLSGLGVRVESAALPPPQRRAFTFVEPEGERTITVLGERRGPRRDEPLAWQELEGADAVYFVSGDVGALRAARAARVVVATPRSLGTLVDAHVPIDALVGSGVDEAERYEAGDLDPPPRAVVRTAGASGGTWDVDRGGSGSWRAASVPGPIRDAYGAGDSFAAGLTWALGEGRALEDALACAAERGAVALTRRGAHGLPQAPRG